MIYEGKIKKLLMYIIIFLFGNIGVNIVKNSVLGDFD